MRRRRLVRSRFSGLLLLTPLLAACQQAPPPPPPAPTPSATAPPAAPAYVPGLGEFMTFQQMRHVKLWFAAEARNWDLAKYEFSGAPGGIRGHRAPPPHAEGLSRPDRPGDRDDVDGPARQAGARRSRRRTAAHLARPSPRSRRGATPAIRRRTTASTSCRSRRRTLSATSRSSPGDSSTTGMNRQIRAGRGRGRQPLTFHPLRARSSRSRSR